MNPALFKVPAGRLMERLRAMEIERDDILTEIKRRSLLNFQIERAEPVEGTGYVACGDARLFINMELHELFNVLREHFKPGLRHGIPDAMQSMTKVEAVNTILLLKGMSGAAGFAPPRAIKPRPSSTSGPSSGRRKSNWMEALS